MMNAGIHWHARGMGAALVAGLMLAAPVAAQETAAGRAAQQAAADPLSPATIRMLQHSLIQGGYAIDAADGIWGPRTAAAVREFQRVKGLDVTGRADRQTLAALGVTANGAAPGGAGDPVRIEARRPADLDRATVRAIQQGLDQQGLQVGPVDGVWGDQTTSALANFQRARELPASGEPDAHTLAALGLLPGGDKPAGNWESGRAPGPADLDPAAIRLIQQSLSQRGFKIGAADGIWGERTADALREFQRSRGIEPAGEPDAHTLAALGLLPGELRQSAGSRTR